VSSNSVPTLQKTNCVYIVKTCVLVLYKKIIAVYFVSHTEHIYTLYLISEFFFFIVEAFHLYVNCRYLNGSVRFQTSILNLQQEFICDE